MATKEITLDLSPDAAAVLEWALSVANAVLLGEYHPHEDVPETIKLDPRVPGTLGNLIDTVRAATKVTVTLEVTVPDRPEAKP